MNSFFLSILAQVERSRFSMECGLVKKMHLFYCTRLKLSLGFSVVALLVLFSGCANKKISEKAVESSQPEAASETQFYRIIFEQVPEVGKTATGQKIYLGGFSGLRFLGKTPEGKLRFVTHTDHGPGLPRYMENGVAKRPLVLPNYQPRIVFFEVDLSQQKATITRQIFLTQPNGKPLTGKLPKDEEDHSVDALGRALPFDIYGMDPEAIEYVGDGSFWMAEQYGPSIAHFSKKGSLLTLLRPGTGLPKILEFRRENRGFESIAAMGKKLYATMQSPLSKTHATEEEKPTRILRIMEVDMLGARTLGQYVYLLDSEGGEKIADMTAIAPRRLLFMEKGHDSREERTKKVFLVDLSEATNLQLLPEKIAGLGGNLEQLSEKNLAAEGIRAAKKKMVFDLEAAGVKEQKIEGIDLVDGHYLALISDNDFMLSGKWNKQTGAVEFDSEKSVFYLIKINKNDLIF